jgi:BASS family bile acid:Na+ symporter
MAVNALVAPFAAIARYAGIVLAAGVFVGLALPALAAAVRPALGTFVWALLVLSAMRIDWRGALREARRPQIVAALVTLLLVATPAVMAAIVRALAVDEGLAAALVLMAAAPPIISSPALALLLGLDAGLSLVVMVAATLTAPVLLPAVVFGLLGLDLDIGAGGLMLRLGLFVATALACGVAGVALLGDARRDRAAVAIDGLAIILLVAFAIAIMDGVGPLALAAPGHVLVLVAAAFAANLGLQAGTTGLCLRLGRRRALTVGFSAGNRNMALLLAVLPATSDPDVLLYFALAQLPIYILPAVLTPLYRRLLRPHPGKPAAM